MRCPNCTNGHKTGDVFVYPEDDCGTSNGVAMKALIEGGDDALDKAAEAVKSAPAAASLPRAAVRLRAPIQPPPQMRDCSCFELHLRQSSGGVWTEVFTGKGDIDYGRLVGWLRKHGIKPHLVLEQAVENGSLHTMDAVAAHKQGAEHVGKLFAEL